MSAPSLVEKLIRSPQSLTWKDVVSGWKEKHTRKDADYAMIAGTTLDSAQTEMSMLQKWQRPWLFFRVFCGGLSAFAVLLAAILVVLAMTIWACAEMTGTSAGEQLHYALFVAKDW